MRKADRVADDLLRRIVRGELVVGALLPKEAELAAHYEVNRSVVREAIKLLEVHRLVRPIRRRGTEVLDPMASVSPEVLQAMLVPGQGRIDADLFGDFLEIRASIDIQMSVLAARRRTEEDVEHLDAHVATLRGALEERERYNLEANRFSVTVARATQNRIFEMLVWWNQEVAGELDSIFDTVRPANEPHLQGIEVLVELIRRQDSVAIRGLVTAFHEWSTPRLMAAVALHGGAPVSSLMEGIES